MQSPDKLAIKFLMPLLFEDPINSVNIDQDY